jgi:hypothetical protein
MKPELDVIEQMGRGIRHALVLRCPAHTEILFTVIEPGERIVRPVELGEVQLVVGWQEIAAVVVLIDTR